MAYEASAGKPNSPETLEMMEYLREALDDGQPCNAQTPSANVEAQDVPSANIAPRESLSGPASHDPPLDETDDETAANGEFDFQDYMDVLQTPPGHADSDTDSQESVSPRAMDQASELAIGEAETAVTSGLSDDLFGNDLFGNGNIINNTDEEEPTDNSDPSQTLPGPTSIPIDPALQDYTNQPSHSQPLATGASTTTATTQSARLKFPVPVPQTAPVLEQIPQAPLQTSGQLKFPVPVPQTAPVSEQIPQAPLQISAVVAADPVELRDADETPGPHPPNSIDLAATGEQLLTQPYSLPSSGDGHFASVKHGIGSLTRYSYPPIQWFRAHEWDSTAVADEPEDQIAEDTEAGSETAYLKYPRPDAWGPGACTQTSKYLCPQSRPVFRYSSRGQWSTETYFTSAELRYYVGMCPRDLKIWIQTVPHKHDRQDEWDMICRWDDCPHKGAIIKPGFLRCSFDEYPHATSNGMRDPFVMAGCMHLYCFEKVFDVAKLYRRKRLSPDTRKFPREWGRKNPMALNRLYPDKDIVRAAFEPWIKSRPDLGNVAASWWNPVSHEETLGYALTLHHCKSSSKRAHAGTQAQERNSESVGRVLPMEEHLGDLVKWLKSTLEEKETRQTAQPRCENPTGEVRVPYEQAMDQTSSSLPPLQSMRADSPGRLSNTEPSSEGPGLGEQHESDEDGLAHSEERCIIEAFCAYRRREDQAEFLIKWVDCTETSWEAADELAEQLTSAELMDLIQPLMDSLSSCSYSSEKKRKQRHDEDEDGDDRLSRTSGSSGYSDKRRKHSHDEDRDDCLSRLSGSSGSSGSSDKKRKQRHDDHEDEDDCLSRASGSSGYSGKRRKHSREEDKGGNDSNAVDIRENMRGSRKKSCTTKPATNAGSKRKSRGDYSDEGPISPSKQVAREQPRRDTAQVIAGGWNLEDDAESAVPKELHQADTQAPASVDINSPDLASAGEDPVNTDASHPATTNSGHGEAQKEKFQVKTRHDGVKKASRQRWHQRRRRRYAQLLRGPE